MSFIKGHTLTAVLIVAAVSLWLFPVSIHVKLISSLSAAVLILVRLLDVWSRGRPKRRRGAYYIMLGVPIFLLAAEAALSLHDLQEARRTAPLRATLAGRDDGLLRRDSDCGFTLSPSRVYDLWGGTVRIDARGFRSTRDVTSEKPHGVTRIMLLGGSSSFGWGVPDGQDIGAHLEELMQEEHTGVEVINASVPYYTSFHEACRTPGLLETYNPDVLIVLSGRNDARWAVLQGERWTPADEGPFGESPFLDLSTHGTAAQLLMRSAVYRRSYHLAVRFTSKPNRQDSETHLDRRFAEELERHWQRIAAAGRARGIRVIIALQPIIHTGRQLAPRETDFAKMWGDQGEAMREAWAQLRETAAESQPEGAQVLDLTDALDNLDGEAYLDECHYTSAGNRRIAERLRAALRE